jgi:hypothetical protein
LAELGPFSNRVRTRPSHHAVGTLIGVFDLRFA